MMKRKFLIASIATALIGSSWLLSSHVDGKDHSFIDVAPDHWAVNEISGAVSAGIVEGYPDGTFRPDASVTRAEFVKLLSTALKLPLSSEGFNWYDRYISAATVAGILRDGDLKGDTTEVITRAEMAKIGSRSLEKSLQDENVDISTADAMLLATKTGLLQGVGGGELALDGVTTRAQSVTIAQRVLQLLAGEKLPTDNYAIQQAEIAVNGTNFESTYGLKPLVNLPAVHNLTDDIILKINEIYFLDGADSESPMWKLLEGARNHSGKSLKDSYIFIYKVDYEVSGDRKYTLRVEDYFYMLGWHGTYSNIAKGVVRPEDRGRVGDYMIFALPKAVDTEEHAIQYDGLKRSAYYISNYLGNSRFGIFKK
ncbi:S-layer homology domain-containing protein [Paenibacillus sp. YYML68]|uniref:S-layer homology domain-containing protein n=1 Tax=Paenibacillus sp. YYML68 TaxID=2909250 RepID=UPI00248F962C|nr:S-layer homology domain-containing protein [Paenibacillus sp. YYML68]